MNLFQLIVQGLRSIADIARNVRDARAADRDAALGGYAAGRSAYDAAKSAGAKPRASPDAGETR